MTFPAATSFTSKEYTKLVDQIQEWSYHYYVLDSPLVSDAEYDEAFRLLQEVEETHPDLRGSDSPTWKVGGEVRSDFPEVEHNPPMLSLDNALDADEFKEFHERMLKTGEEILYHVEPKFDGVAAELVYVDGVLETGSTRGDGRLGEDVTHNLKTVQNVPLRLRAQKTGRVIVRGEVLMGRDDFIKLNETLEEKGTKIFANPRNASSGSLRQKDSSITASRPLAFMPYSLLLEGEDQLPQTQTEIWNTLLPEMGFKTSKLAATFDYDGVLAYYDKIHAERMDIPWDIDGLVIKLDNLRAQLELGNTTRAPRYAIAFKFPARSALTRLENVVFQVGRTGVITPVAELSPINIGGVIVSRATLHNSAQVKKLELHYNDIVEVVRSGDVIPKVVRVMERDKKAKPVSFPEKCPECDSTLEHGEIFVYCPNRNCRGRQTSQLRFFVSRSGMDIETLGGEWIQKLYDGGQVKTPADIFSLKREDLDGYEGMGDILAAKILASIDSRRTTPFSVFLRSLGMNGVGSHVAEVLADHFTTLDKLRKATVEELTQVHEIGPETARAVVEFFADEANAKLVDDLLQNGVTIEQAEEKKGDIFAGKTFVFTGTLEKLSRSEGEAMVKEQGGKASSSVSKKTDYVVAGANAGSKLEKANDLGVTVITEEQFFELFNNG